MLHNLEEEGSRAKNKHDPEEKIPGMQSAIMSDFWSWAYSDIFSNTVRPLFAEFIVGHALGALNGSRIEWIPYDFEYQGKKIEVKSSGYLQNYPQKKPSVIEYDIETRKKAWDHKNNVINDMTERSADCYVFCLHHEMDEKISDVIDVTQWSFYVLSRESIDKHFGMQKRVRLSRIQGITNAVPYSQLKEKIGQTLNESQ